MVAHELGHVHSRDVPRGLLWLAIVALPGTFLVQVLTERIAPRELSRAGARGGGARGAARAGAVAGAGQLRR